MDKKNSLINLGCRLNIYEGEIIKDHLNNNNIKNVTVINSCAVTAEAEKKVAYEIRKAKKNNPKNKIVVTGCAAQINPKKYDTIKEVDLVLGNKEKLISNVWNNLNFAKSIQVEDILLEKKTVPTSIEKFDGKSRAYIEIQQGCDHRCTFCIIPYGRGNNRSVPAGEIVERIKKIVNNGYKEVVLTGVEKFLIWAKSNNISMGVCTNKQEHLAIKLLLQVVQLRSILRNMMQLKKLI